VAVDWRDAVRPSDPFAIMIATAALTARHRVNMLEGLRSIVAKQYSPR
jgi:hypothetical protein